MSETIPTPSQGSTPVVPHEVWWIKPAITLANKLIFIIVLVAALLMKMEQLISMLAGAVITMALNPDNFYFGSSSGSAGKDATIAAQAKSNQPN